MSEYEMFVKGTSGSKDNIIVSFGGLALRFDGIPPFEFLNHLSNNFDCDLLLYVDPERSWYHLGIDGMTKDIPSTAEHIHQKIKDYKNVIFLGVSAGGYGAIMFGSLLKVQNVIAYIPQTSLLHPKDIKYKDTLPYINDITHYTLYYDTNKPASNHLHYGGHCTRFENRHNFTLIGVPNLNMRKLRDTGVIKDKLKTILI